MDVPREGLEVTPILVLRRYLGEGGMGEVWVAYHRGLETEVAIKFLTKDKEGPDPEGATARFVREASTIAAVKSPHVVQVLDHGTTASGLRYIVMELLEGRDLAAYLQAHGTMSPPDAAAVIAQVGKALSKAHQAGVIHRDIKPANIFLCDAEGGELFVKVLDFGGAKRRRQEASFTTWGGYAIGTPSYMSPEQIVGETTIDLRTDIWAMGVVAFELLTGQKPFQGTNLVNLSLAIHGTTPNPSVIAPSLPIAIDAWFARACAKAPADRFQGAREAAHALVAAAGPAPSNSLPLVRVPDSLRDLPEVKPREGDPAEKPPASDRSPASLVALAASPATARGTRSRTVAKACVAALLVFGLILILYDVSRPSSVRAASASASVASPATALVTPPAAAPSPGPGASAERFEIIEVPAPSASAAEAVPSRRTAPPVLRRAPPRKKPIDDEYEIK